MPAVDLTFTVRDLTTDDLAVCGWAGAGVPHELERVGRGEVDYLCLSTPAGVPVATGGVNYTEAPGAGTLYQLHVHELLRNCGLGTVLIAAAEQRIRARGLSRAELGVDEADQRPRPLYERLGYVAFGAKPCGWDQQQPDGSVGRYETTAVLLAKSLPPLEALDPLGRG